MRLPWACEVRLAKGVFCLSVVKTGYKPASVIIPNSTNEPEIRRF